MPVGWRGSAHRPTVARSLRHGKHHALFEALAESTDAGQGKPDFRLDLNSGLLSVMLLQDFPLGKQKTAHLHLRFIEL